MSDKEKQKESVRKCEIALDKFEFDLAKKKNVVGLGIVPVDEEDPDNAEMAVAVYVTKKEAPKDVAPKDAIPKTLSIKSAKRTSKVRTKVIEQGEVYFEGM